MPLPKHPLKNLQNYRPMASLRKKGFPSAKILGYDIQGCHSLESGRNLCNTKDIQTIINRAKSMKEPNFDRDKKLVEFKHQTKRYDYETLRSEFDDSTTRLTTMNITDIIVVDEKAKKMYVSDAFAYNIEYDKPAPNIYTLKNSSWYCLKEDGTDFIIPLEVTTIPQTWTFPPALTTAQQLWVIFMKIIQNHGRATVLSTANSMTMTIRLLPKSAHTLGLIKRPKTFVTYLDW